MMKRNVICYNLKNASIHVSGLQSDAYTGPDMMDCWEKKPDLVGYSIHIRNRVKIMVLNSISWHFVWKIENCPLGSQKTNIRHKQVSNPRFWIIQG